MRIQPQDQEAITSSNRRAVGIPSPELLLSHLGDAETAFSEAKNHLYTCPPNLWCEEWLGPNPKKSLDTSQ